MFVRKVKRGTTRNVSVQIVESYRVPGKGPRQRIVRHMGSAPEGPQLDALIRLAHRARLQIEEERQPHRFPAEYAAGLIYASRNEQQGDSPLRIPDARKLKEIKRLAVGIHEVFGALYARMGFDKVFGSRKKMAARLFREAVLMRLALSSGSRPALREAPAEHHGAAVNPDKHNRMMEALDEGRIAGLQSKVANEVRGLLDEQVDILFCNVTTLVFTSDMQDALPRQGFRRDGKPQSVRVVLALFQTEEGLPIGFELFPGNSVDVRTLKPALKALHERIQAGRAVLVADTGILSESNLDLLTLEGWDWVVAARLRNLPHSLEAKLFAPQDWSEVSEDASVTELQLKGRRLVLRHSANHAARDAWEREKTVAKLQRRLAQGIKGSGRRSRFLKVSRRAVELDQAAIDRDASFDGIRGVWTSLDRDKHAAHDICGYYGALRRIDEDFRVRKATSAAQTIHEWTPGRARAEIAIRFVAFALLRLLRYQYNCMHAGQEPLSEARILKELAHVQTSLVVDTSTLKRYLIASPATNVRRALYSAVGLELPSMTRELVAPQQPLQHESKR